MSEKDKKRIQAATKKLLYSILADTLITIIAAFLTVVILNFEVQGYGFRVKTLAVAAILYAAILIGKDVLVYVLTFVRVKNHRIRTIVTILKSVVTYAGFFIFIAVFLKQVHVDTSAILAGVGIIALIIGFGAESLIADTVTGVFMLFENQYNVGDYIEVDGFRGKVTSIGVRTTCLEDAGGNVKIINNSKMSSILNRSDHTSKSVCVIGIPYETDLEALEAKIPNLMKEIHEKHADVLLNEPVYLGVDALADSSVNLKFVAEVDDKNIYSATRILNHDIFLGFRKLGVEVPFNQIDVHQK